MNFSITELNELIYSLGTTASKGMLCDKELNASLLDKLYAELNYKLQIQSDITNEVIDRVKSHYVSNEEADEDTNINYLYIPKTNGATQSILNFVEQMGFASYGQMNNEYRRLTGSNSFSHILKALIIPYKNRPTRRYLRQAARGVYVVEIATPQNWVVKN